MWLSGINLTRGRGKVEGASGRNALTRRKGVGMFGSALLRHEGVWVWHWVLGSDSDNLGWA